jgi:hypothetical protein
MDLIEKACPPKLMIEEVDSRCVQVKEQIQQLEHIQISEVDKFVKQPVSLEYKIHLFLCT